MTAIRNNFHNDFPQLKDDTYHFLDSAASTLVPQVVLDSVSEFYSKDKANVHRGEYGAAVRATERYEKARQRVADFIGADVDEVIFSSGATEASNMLTRTLDESLRLNIGDEIVTTLMEHHSSLVPLQQLAKRRSLTLKHIDMTTDFSLDYDVAEKLITAKTKIVSIMLASNVMGTINDVARIAKLAHAVGAFVIIDATSAVGHIPVNVKELDADALYFSGHKVLAPTGVGVLFLKREFVDTFNSSSFGGHMIDEVTLSAATFATGVTKFEAGTKDIGGVIGLGESVSYLSSIGVANIHAQVGELVSYAISELKKVEGVRVIAQHDPKLNTGIVSFFADWAHPHDIAEIIARDNVAVRAGHHCAMPLHCELKLSGTVRASFHLYNTNSDTDALIVALMKAHKIFN